MLVLLGLTAAIVWPTEEDRPPTAVLIVADDLGWGDVGFQGRTAWRTPELDRPSGRGTALSRFDASACVCGPNRAGLMSGRALIRYGVRRDREDVSLGEVTLAETLASRGYAPTLDGKCAAGNRGQGRVGDTLVECSGQPNGARPTAFVPGDGRPADVVTFRRKASVPEGPSPVGTSGISMR